MWVALLREFLAYKQGCSDAVFPQVLQLHDDTKSSKRESLKVSCPSRTAAAGTNHRAKRRRHDENAVKNDELQLATSEAVGLHDDPRSNTSSNGGHQFRHPWERNKEVGSNRNATSVESDFRKVETEQELVNSALQLGPNFSMQCFIYDGEKEF